MGLIIAGDLVPSRDDIDLFASGDVEALLGKELFEIWNGAEHRIFNLEAPITNSGNPILKCGPNIRINENCINGIEKLRPSIIALANNHIMDYGEDGLNKTISILKHNKIKYIGVGNNINEIKKYDLLTIDGKKVAIYNCAEKEFSIATDNNPGAYAYEESEIIKDLTKLNKKNDFTIVIYHGGKEHYRYPSPQLRKRCKTMVENGASLVVCQHSHCIGCMEKINNSYIIYGQGNFLFNLDDNEYWKTSLLLNVTFDTKININYIPFVRKKSGVSIPNKGIYQTILNDFKLRSYEIKKNGFVEAKYDKFSKELIDDYLCALHGRNILFRIVKKIVGKKCLKIYYSKEDYARILNYFECEAYNEIIINGLKHKLKDDKK